MGAQEFGRLVDRVIRDRGLSQARVGARVGELPDGRILNEKAIERIREGGRRLDHMLVERLIDVLDLDPAEAWSAAGLWPPDLDLVEYRRLRESGRPEEPALTRVGGGDTPLASSLRKTPTSKGRRRGNSWYRVHAGHCDPSVTIGWDRAPLPRRVPDRAAEGGASRGHHLTVPTGHAAGRRAGGVLRGR